MTIDRPGNASSAAQALPEGVAFRALATRIGDAVGEIELFRKD